jgi:outer membrane protein|tara:strand:+ start:134 stop:652 length:519 start_codon:yes stop_codon:yes gene_type:complete
MKKLIVILIFFIFQSNFAIPDTNIVFVDLDKIVKISKPGASILNQLNKKNEKILKSFLNEEKNLKKKEKKYVSQKNIISNEEFQSNINKLKLEINEYNNKRMKTINDFKKLKIRSTNNFLQMINPILTEYSDKKSISLILQKKNLIIGKTELDITDEIIKIINIEIKEFEIE